MDDQSTTPTASPQSSGPSPLLWVVVILVVAGLAYGLYSVFLSKKSPSAVDQTQTQAPTAAQAVSPTTTAASPSSQVEQTQNTVTLTSSGFTPTTLTIKKGQTVTWVNKSGTEATVNSDPHPVHTAYPPLNLGSFANNGTLTLTFPTAGAYGYHNHLNPAERGTIIVE